jgi:transposase
MQSTKTQPDEPLQEISTKNWTCPNTEDLGNIVTFFVHRLTNGPIEGLNNKIQELIKKAFGYRNKERFKADILFHLGGLALYPAQ